MDQFPSWKTNVKPMIGPCMVRLTSVPSDYRRYCSMRYPTGKPNHLEARNDVTNPASHV